MMHLKDLYYFLVVAEELNFTRAASRIHIEPSPLSKAIKKFEERLKVRLLRRARGSVQLTQSGITLMKEAKNIMAQVENAKNLIRLESRGLQGLIRVGLSDGLASPRFGQLLALSRAEAPGIEIPIQVMVLPELYRALQGDRLDIGFTIDPRDYLDSVIKVGVWCEQLAVALPIRHPLLAYSKVPFKEALRYPLITFHPEYCAEGYHMVRHMLGKMMRGRVPDIVEYHAIGHGQMLMLVAAGYGVAFGLESQLSLYRHPDVFVRPIDDAVDITTFAVLPKGDISQKLEQFVQRAQAIGDLKNTEAPTSN
jgi:DNA-binding transcriptional LysR family regulator